jgi:hypothetical protein
MSWHSSALLLTTWLSNFPSLRSLYLCFPFPFCSPFPCSILCWVSFDSSCNTKLMVVVYVRVVLSTYRNEATYWGQANPGLFIWNQWTCYNIYLNLHHSSVKPWFSVLQIEYITSSFSDFCIKTFSVKQ